MNAAAGSATLANRRGDGEHHKILAACIYRKAFWLRGRRLPKKTHERRAH